MTVDVPPRARRRLLALLATACAGCGGGAPESPVGPAAEPGVFRDVTSDAGLDFVHFTGDEGEYRFPEIMGAGLALFDFDGDGDLDLYLVQGAAWSASAAAIPPGNRLLRNDLVRGDDGRREIRFVDVTTASGAGDTGYGMGAAIGDYDRDGDYDLYVTNYGPNSLYRNNGDGSFVEIGEAAGVASSAWSTSASFLDYDGDGDLDLFHANYVAFAEDSGRECRRPAGDRDYCTPLAYRAQPDVLYRNRGDGTFEDATAVSGLSAAFGNGMGTVAADFNGDSRPDLYVANDGGQNQLWINQGEGRFADEALLSGVAFNGEGEPEAGMGIAAGDFDGDRDLDLFLTHLSLETNTLYVNQGNGFFADASLSSDLALASKPMTGFGTHFLDYDGDGALDVLVVNGAVTKVESQLDDDYPYMMPNQLFRATSPGRFQDVSTGAGDAFQRFESSRGTAIGDLDLDGDVDAAITNNRGRARVLRNEVGALGHWLSVRLAAADVTPPQLEVVAPALAVQTRTPHTDGSYCSARDPRAFFGLGADAGPVTLSARWPRGANHSLARSADRPSSVPAAPGAAKSRAAESPAAESRPVRALRATVLGFGAGLALALAGCGPSHDLPPIPEVEIGDVDPVIHRQLTDARRAVDARPHDAAAAGRLGMLYELYQYPAAARVSYARAGTLAPEEFSWLYYLGRLERAEGDAGAAVATLTAALDLDPSYAPALAELGEAQIDQGAPDKAEAAFRQALAVAPDSVLRAPRPRSRARRPVRSPRGRHDLPAGTDPGAVPRTAALRPRALVPRLGSDRRRGAPSRDRRRRRFGQPGCGSTGGRHRRARSGDRSRVPRGQGSGAARPFPGGDRAAPSRGRGAARPCRCLGRSRHRSHAR